MRKRPESPAYAGVPLEAVQLDGSGAVIPAVAEATSAEHKHKASLNMKWPRDMALANADFEEETTLILYPSGGDGLEIFGGNVCQGERRDLLGARHLALTAAGRVISRRAFGPWRLMGAARTQPYGLG